MDPLDVIILALRLALALVLYLFLLAVMRAGRRTLADATADTRIERPAVLGLRVEEPAGSGLTPGQVLDVPDGATLGRGSGVEVRVADPTVSSSHARLARSGRRWLVDDLGSTNGTTVNETPVHKQAELRAGDVLALGNVKLRVQDAKR
jgi:FHA domain